MDHLVDVASSVGTPLGLAGLALAVLFGIVKAVVALDVFPKLSPTLSSKLLNKIVDRMFVLALVAVLLGFLGYISPSVANYFDSKARESSITCSPVVQNPTGPVTINCQGVPQDQLNAINEILAQEKASAAITKKFVEVLQTVDASGNRDVQSAMQLASRLKEVSDQLERVRTYDSSAANKAKEALNEGDIEGARAYIEAARKIRVNDKVTLRYGNFIIGQQGEFFDPILAYHGRILTHTPTDPGESLSYDDDFGVKRLGLFDVILLARSGGGEVCPENWIVLTFFQDEVNAYQFGNCNEDIIWRETSNELKFTVRELDRGSGALSPEDRQQIFRLELGSDGLVAALNGRPLDPSFLK
ncbi:hypothetical protein [Frateuria terrea]|uniref:Uncharacterized protein n=1 Tax=Frateuria terrea TaxID=529704 RepID=A0A1H6SHW6_9GAMM|nr:hypothetical protein [Frateuria terrea]SEI67481.1 hypothetical protein SAMN04487997_1423 [Frateuria terrea]SFP26655.1 hypothetical protein SAMN02927913_1338 [Frateuria terrea]